MTDDFAVRLGFTSTLGWYLAVNAIPDALLIVDGKDCVVQMATQIQGNHDLRSTLVSCESAHRILTTSFTPEDAWMPRDETLEQVLQYAVARRDVGVIMLGALRSASITEPPYDMIVETVAEQSGTAKPMMTLPTRSLRDDWLSGYAEALAALAEHLPLRSPSAPSERSVAIVGYLMDRGEDDHLANLRELGRLLQGIGAELVSTWLQGTPSPELAEAGRARHIISFPYARDAAATLARRTGASLIETDLPMGLEGTSRWLRQIGGALGLESRAERFIDQELAEAAPRLEWLVSLLLTDLAVGFAGDPFLMRGFIEMAHELGLRVPFRMIWAQESDEHRDLEDDVLDDPLVIVDPREGEAREPFARLVKDQEIRMLVGNSYALSELRPNVAAFELGYPSFHAHALTEHPFLGYRGCLSLVARMTERLKLHDLLGR